MNLQELPAFLRNETGLKCEHKEAPGRIYLDFVDANIVLIAVATALPPETLIHICPDRNEDRTKERVCRNYGEVLTFLQEFLGD